MAPAAPEPISETPQAEIAIANGHKAAEPEKESDDDEVVLLADCALYPLSFPSNPLTGHRLLQPSLILNPPQLKVKLPSNDLSYRY